VRIIIGAVVFVALVVLFLTGGRISAPAVIPPPAPVESTSCPLPTTPEQTPPPAVTATVTAGGARAVWLQRGAPCPGVEVPST
jgi:hypothetical protein